MGRRGIAGELPRLVFPIDHVPSEREQLKLLSYHRGLPSQSFGRDFFGAPSDVVLTQDEDIHFKYAVGASPGRLGRQRPRPRRIQAEADQRN